MLDSLLQEVCIYNEQTKVCLFFRADESLLYQSLRIGKFPCVKVLLFNFLFIVLRLFRFPPPPPWNLMSGFFLSKGHKRSVYGHIMLKAPVLVRSLKLSNIELR